MKKVHNNQSNWFQAEKMVAQFVFVENLRRFLTSFLNFYFILNSYLPFNVLALSSERLFSFKTSAVFNEKKL